MWANGISLPERSQEFGDVHYHGYPFKYPTVMTMGQETTIPLKCDANGEIRRACLAWEGKISNPAITDGSMGEGNKKIPKDSNVRILCFDEDMENVVETYRLVGAAVSKVGELEFSNDSADVATFDLDLVFQYWEIEDVDSSGKFNDIR